MLRIPEVVAYKIEPIVSYSALSCNYGQGKVQQEDRKGLVAGGFVTNLNFKGSLLGLECNKVGREVFRLPR